MSFIGIFPKSPDHECWTNQKWWGNTIDFAIQGSILISMGSNLGEKENWKLTILGEWWDPQKVCLIHKIRPIEKIKWKKFAIFQGWHLSNHLHSNCSQDGSSLLCFGFVTLTVRSTLSFVARKIWGKQNFQKLLQEPVW